MLGADAFRPIERRRPYFRKSGH